MHLESLANELLLDLFEFLNGVHLLRAFYGLNSRFDNLIFTESRSISFDFRHVSKNEFDIVCRQHLPSIVDRIISLHLSDDDEHPQQVNFFLSHSLTLGQFINLESLSLSHIKSGKIMDKMIKELHHLTHLQCLNITGRYFQSSYVDSIWYLQKLIQCKLEVIRDLNWSKIPTVKSTSLQRLTILKSTLSRFDFDRLSEYTPCLRHLVVDHLRNPPIQKPVSEISLIETLSLSFVDLIDALEDIVQHLRHLSQLTVNMRGNIYIDGHQWEKMITDYLPKLKVFRLLMTFEYGDNIGGEEQVDQILDSFRTHFWIDEHQWFVRCHWKSYGYKKSYCLYTLPYAFHQFIPHTDTRFKSTCAEDDGYFSYDRVHDMSYHSSSSADFRRLRFPNLHNLRLLDSIPDHFWSVVPILDRLTSLILDFDIDTSFFPKLQRLFDMAPRLYSLTSHDSIADVTDLTSKSIRRLELKSRYYSCTSQTCTLLCRSSLVMQCEVLIIELENGMRIFDLVDAMKNLRALIVRCDDFYPVLHDGTPDWSAPIIDEPLERLLQNLPGTCQISRHRRF